MNLTANLILVGVTCLISIAGFQNATFFDNAAHHPYVERHKKQYYRLLTSGFVHADIWHLFVNMFVLYTFGSFVEQRFLMNFGSVGSIYYAAFYVVSIVLANLSTHFKYGENYSYRAIGASGATSAVLFSYIYYQPLSMLGIYFIIPMPAIIFGILYLWYSSWSAKKGRDNIGHEAHFYGAIAGFVLSILLDPKQFGEFLYSITHFNL